MWIVVYLEPFPRRECQIKVFKQERDAETFIDQIDGTLLKYVEYLDGKLVEKPQAVVTWFCD